MGEKVGGSRSHPGLVMACCVVSLGEPTAFTVTATAPQHRRLPHPGALLQRGQNLGEKKEGRNSGMWAFRALMNRI